MKIKETKSYTVKYDDSIDFQCTAKLSIGGKVAIFATRGKEN